MNRSYKFAAHLTPILIAILFSSCASTRSVAPSMPLGNGTGGSGNSAGSGSGSATGSSSPANAAFVYVSSTPQSGGASQVEAYAASSDGKLTAVAGSPLQANVSSMAVNGSHLFAVNSNGVDLESYSVASNGSLTHETTTHAAHAGNCNSLGNLFLDRTAATLYALSYRGSGCANNTYESFSVDQSTGALGDLGNSGANNWLSLPASFLPSNTNAYTASCLTDMYWGIWGFQRSSSGLLTQVSIKAAPPTPPSGYFYCPSSAAADASGHVAMVMQPVNQQTFNPDKPAQLAIYTAQSNGDLTTANTAANMPAVTVGAVNDIQISPAGDLLAVGGATGLQVFHFNGSNSVSAYTGVLTSDPIDQFFWDNQNHLYAISQKAGKLYVFTVSASSYVQAAGSPHAIAGPQNIGVLAE